MAPPTESSDPASAGSSTGTASSAAVHTSTPGLPDPQNTTTQEPETKPSTQRLTALSLVSAFNSMSIPKITSLRSPTCERHILPTSLNQPTMSNTTYLASLQALLPLFHNFSLKLHDLVEDLPARKIVMYLTARADTEVGEYVNEYVWFLDFDGSGTKVVRSAEFVDALVNVRFFPKLAEAMRVRREGGGAAESGEGEGAAAKEAGVER